MTIEEIIKYVTTSPENTNPNVLKGMLENISSGDQDIPEGAFILMPIFYNEDTGVFNSTWQEINDLTNNHIMCAIEVDDLIYPLEAVQNDSDYIIYAGNGENKLTFVTDSPNGYPAPSENPPTEQDPLGPGAE